MSGLALHSCVTSPLLANIQEENVAFVICVSENISSKLIYLKELLIKTLFSLASKSIDSTFSIVSCAGKVIKNLTTMWYKVLHVPPEAFFQLWVGMRSPIWIKATSLTSMKRTTFVNIFLLLFIADNPFLSSLGVKVAKWFGEIYPH